MMTWTLETWDQVQLHFQTFLTQLVVSVISFLSVIVTVLKASCSDKLNGYLYIYETENMQDVDMCYEQKEKKYSNHGRVI